MGLTRRAILGGLAVAWGGRALAQVRPLARPAPVPLPRPLRPAARATVAELAAAAGLDGRVSVLLVDAATGTVVEALEPEAPRPPASVAKALTALYALDALGPAHRFATRVLATGPVADGIVRGHLVLAGGGDPVLVTDRLAELAGQVRAAGIRGATGGLKAWGGALPALPEIAGDQPPVVGYNPAISGLNLNFNRVHLEWARRGGAWDLRLDARGDLHRPPVSVASVRVEPRERPTWTYLRVGRRDEWTVAEADLGEAGSRWLPVRSPALYAGQAFAGLLGLDLPVEEIDALPAEAAEVALIEGEPLAQVARDMLLFSTNLTAEVLGLAASLARGLPAATPADSAAAMGRWLREGSGVRVEMVDHSGLGAASRVTARELALLLCVPALRDRLAPLLRLIDMTDAEGEPLAAPPGTIRAKTGTLNFVSTLAGYLATRSGRDLAFAILAADTGRRAEAVAGGEEVPEGSLEWNQRARRLQQVLLQRWAAGA